MNPKNLVAERLVRRKSSRKSGLIWFVSGLLVLLNSPFLVPIPIVGLPSVLLASILLLIGVRKIIYGLKLPISESLMIIDHAGGEISQQKLIEALGGSSEVNAEELLIVLDKKDWARKAIHHLPYVENKELDGGLIDGQLVILLEGGKQQLVKEELLLNKE